ncbi:hypothetical protein [Chamaesiphon polymorphus]|uniref:hypothetical protein n=1 Tax=Chamaesiphon polymorphus TaxID=2107691 RepID=UPI0015E6BCD7|nr:hypothetical protein [Chamaesiphon polymorphus]
MKKITPLSPWEGSTAACARAKYLFHSILLARNQWMCVADLQKAVAKYTYR